MNFNQLIFCFLLFLSCSKSGNLLKNNAIPIIDTKTKNALYSCNQLKFPQDIKFSGKFMYHFPQCASNKNESGEETLQGTINLVKAAGEDGLQKIADFLSLNPSNEKSADHRPKYPLIRALTVLLERGAIDNTNSSAIDYDPGQFENLQTLLMEINPYYAVHLLLGLSETGSLYDLLEDLSILSTEGEIESFLAFTRTILVNPALKEKFLALGLSLIENDQFFLALKNILSLEKTQETESKDRDECINGWEDPVLVGEIENSCTLNSNSRTPWENGKAHYQNFVNQVGNNSLGNAAKFIGALFQDFAELEGPHRLEVLNNISKGLEESFFGVHAPLNYLIGLGEKIFGDHPVLVKDLDSLVNGVDKLIKEVGPGAIITLNQKVAMTKLKDEFKKMLRIGGKIPGCGDLTLPGLEGVGPDDYIEYTLAFLKPHKDCMQNLSPAASWYFSTIEKEIGLPNNCNPEKLSPEQKKTCITTEDKLSVSKKLAVAGWTGTNEKVVDHEPLAFEFLNDQLDLMIAKLKKDPFALYFENLAKGAVDSNLLEKLKTDLVLLRPFNPQTLLQLDQKLTKQSKQILPRGFLEKLFNHGVREYQASLEEFPNLMEESSDQTVGRLFLGLYNQGPLEQIVGQMSYLENIPTELQPPDPFLAKKFLSWMRMPGYLFKNKTIDPSDEEMSLSFFGEKSNSVELIYEKDSGEYLYKGVGLRKDPLFVDDLFNKNTWRLSNNFLGNQGNQDVLISKDARNKSAGATLQWLKEKFYPYLENINWKNSLSQKTLLRKLSNKFLEVGPYNVDEARKLALFYSMHYLSAPGFLPSNNLSFEIKQNYGRTKPKIKPQFLSLPEDPDKKWNTFLKYFPNSMNGERENFELFLENSWPEITEKKFVDLAWENLPKDRSRQRELVGLEGAELEVVKVLSTLNLLTTNSEHQYMPLVGIENKCWFRNGDKTSCPLLFKNFTTENGVPVTGFESLKGFVRDTLHFYSCPYLSESFGFSGAFIQQIQEQMGIKNVSQAFKDRCHTEFEKKNLMIMDVNGQNRIKRIPPWVFEHTLMDLFSLGKFRKLKPGLNTFTSRMQIIKAKAEGTDTLRAWFASAGLLPHGLSIYHQKQRASHQGFLTKEASWANVYLNFLGSVISSQNDHLKTALAYYGPGIKVGEDLNQGIVQKLIMNLIILPHQYFNNRNAPLSQFVLEVLERLFKPENSEFRRTLSYLMADPDDLEWIPNFTATTQLLFTYMQKQTGLETDVFWDHPGHSFARQLLRTEFLKGLSELTYDFKAQEFNSLLNSLSAHYSLLGDTNGQHTLLKSIYQFSKKWFLTKNKMGLTTIDKMGASFNDLFEYDFKDTFLPDLSTLLELMSAKQIGFDGKEKKSVASQFGTLNTLVFQKGHHGLFYYQSFFDIFKNEKKDYLRELFYSILRPLKKDDGKGTKALSNLLEHPGLGRFHDIYEKLLFNTSYRSLTLEVLKILGSAQKNDYVLALNETHHLLPHLHNILKFVTGSIDWRSDTSIDSIEAAEALYRLSVPNNFIWDKQYQLMSFWLETTGSIK